MDNIHQPIKSTQPWYRLDITSEVCPLTLVRTKLFLENLPPHTLVQIRLNAGEPVENIPHALKELGHTIISLSPENPQKTNQTYSLLLRTHSP